jgi:hypothetical protein
MATVDKMKTKMIRWKAFTRTTLDTSEQTADNVNKVEEKKEAQLKKKSFVAARKSMKTTSMKTNKTVGFEVDNKENDKKEEKVV